MRQFFSFAFLSAISYLCHRVFDKSKWNTKDTAFKVDKSLPRLLPYAVCQIVRFDWNFWWQKVPKNTGLKSPCCGRLRVFTLTILFCAPDPCYTRRKKGRTFCVRPLVLSLSAVLSPRTWPRGTRGSDGRYARWKSAWGIRPGRHPCWCSCRSPARPS